MTSTATPADAVPSSPPIAEQRPTSVERFGETFHDPYAWLRDRDDEAVLEHLRAENAWTDAVLAPTKPLQDELFAEFKARVEENDETAPVRRGDWWWSTRTEEGKSYAIHVRRHGAPDAEPEVWLDANELAAGHEYFAMGALAISPDQRRAAYATDTDGSEIFTMRIRDLSTGEDLDDVIPKCSYGVTWRDADTLLYTVQNDMMRPFQVWQHRLGTSVDDDVLVFEEPDERFFVGVGKTRSRRFLAIHLGSAITSEVRLLDLDDADADWRVVAEREDGVEYDVDHVGDWLWITSNANGATNFALSRVRVDAASWGTDAWETVVAARDDVKLDGVDAFASALVAYERAEANVRLRLLRLSDDGGEIVEDLAVEQDEEVYAAAPSATFEFDTPTCRYGYQSLVTPKSVYDLDLTTGERTLVKRETIRPAPDGRPFRSEDYVTSRVWAESTGGARVPLSVVHRADVALDGTAPCLLYGYGSYEYSIDPVFSTLRLALLDRGMVFAIAHVRGGGEQGRAWYEDGKFANKQHTFDDFAAAARRLVEGGWTAHDRLAIRGGSAGGLLIGACVNQHPELYAAAVAEVPFVDVLNTMNDDTLPLTVIEYEEWGNPTIEEFHHVMRAYSPYDNVREQDYPHLLCTGGLNDPRVGYWEPAKFVARLREVGHGDNDLLLRTELGAGHGGRSGRYDAWRDEAEVQAFILTRTGAVALD